LLSIRLCRRSSIVAAPYLLGKIDEILGWEQRKETERDTKFVELGRYLCKVRAGPYWTLESLKCFDEFLERRFPESRRKAYYLMSIHEHLPPQSSKELKEVGWAKGIELVKLARRDRRAYPGAFAGFDCATWLGRARHMPKEDLKKAAAASTTGSESGYSKSGAGDDSDAMTMNPLGVARTAQLRSNLRARVAKRVG
jgi:hypothetical protein